MKHKRVIIWGYKLYSHTHSYIHAGYYNAFKNLGYETHWIDGKDNFDPQLFNDALIFTEQWAVIGNPNIPLFTNSTYAVHYIGNKDTRVEGNPGAGAYLGKVGRLIDVRYNADKWVDKNYNYSLDRSKATKIGAGCYFEKGSDYDYFYTTWATDLLPDEINLEDMYIPKENYVFFAGTIGGGQGGPKNCKTAPPEYDNLVYLNPFIQACEENDIEFKYNCPWISPQSFEEQRKIIQKSYLAPDVRHKAFKEWGYIPCRNFKNISYGQLGITNSKPVYEFFDGNIIYNEDTYQLFFDAQKQRENYDLIKSQMLFVKENHTYINRVKELIEVVNY